MAKSFKEIGKKAEALIEQGKEADQKVQSCQARVASSNSRVAVARRQLAAASETDEEGNPAGNVEQARAQLSMAENQLAASQRALSQARGVANRVRAQKNDHVQEIERHNRVERSNLEKLRRLKTGAFSVDSAALTEGMAQRLNEAENARAALLRSMGIEATSDHVAVGGEGNTDSEWRGGGFSQIDTRGETQSYQGGDGAGGLTSKGIRTPLGGGLGTILNRIFNGDAKDSATKDTEFQNVPSMGKTVYTDVNQLSDDLYNYTEDYVENAAKYNQPLRLHSTTPEVEHFRDLINSHQVGKDSVYIRKASLADIGSKFSALPIEELVGRCYQFEGIMSVAKYEGVESIAKADLWARGDATFEIHVPEGTQGLDLTQVGFFKQGMFDSPFCYIESVTKKEGTNSPHFVVRMLSAGDKLNRANDFDSLQKYMDSQYKMTLDASIEKLDVDTVKSAIGGVEAIIREYPDVGAFLKSGITSDSGVMSCTGSTLSFNPNYFGDDRRLHSTCKDMSRRGFWVANASTSSVGIHEAAHGVEWAIIQANPRYTTEAQRVTAWNNCTEASLIVKTACANVQNTEYGFRKTRTELVRSISAYALENDSETMAEAFADVYANGVNAKPLSKEIKRLTNILMNKYKGGIGYVDIFRSTVD